MSLSAALHHGHSHGRKHKKHKSRNGHKKRHIGLFALIGGTAIGIMIKKRRKGEATIAWSKEDTPASKSNSKASSATSTKK